VPATPLGDNASRPKPAHLDGGTLALLVDDDVELGELLQDALDEHGIRVEVAHDGRRGLARALSGEHDLLLLDVMLPGLDGFELLRLVRRQSRVPVIMLTARTATADQVAGLDAGADDYLPKPFGTALLLARIRAVLRRSGRVVEEMNVLEAGRSNTTSSSISSAPPAGSSPGAS
jgi:two-component system response regulator CpxR